MRSLPALTTPVAAPAWPLRHRPLQWALLLLAVLLLHGLLLLVLVAGSAPGVVVAQRPAAMQLLPPTPRRVPQVLAEVPAQQFARTPVDEPADTPVARRAQSAEERAARRADAKRAAVAVPTGQADGAPALPALRLAAAADAAAPPLASTEALVKTAPQLPTSAAQTAVPVYATRLPGPASLQYRLQRGAVVGSGQLVWQRQDDAYEISLEGELQGMPVLGSVSRGAIDADGVAPLRLAERRHSRELRAANFQRDAQRITFSGPQTEYPLLAGAQDRLSWMIQLPGIVEADASLRLTGARVTLFVVGTRGDAEAWHFEVQGREALELPAGAVANALYLLREPRRPYDTRVEVWLDPARQHLPVRAVVTTVPGGQPLEFELSRAMQAAL